jgi:hypothetical protein
VRDILALQSAVGNRAMGGLLRRYAGARQAPPARTLARCEGACTCGGKCRADRAEEDAELSRLSKQLAGAVLARQAVPIPEVEPPPPRPQLRVIPGGASESEGKPLTGPEGERYAEPSPWDDSFEAALQRANIESEIERMKLQEERPLATLDRGGTAPSFITEHGTRRYVWIGGPRGGGSMQVRVRQFHVLDAIEAAIAKANTEQDLQGVADSYLPGVGRANRLIDQAAGKPVPLVPISPLYVPSVPLGDEPVYPSNFDPGGAARIDTFQTAVGKRAQQAPALAKSRLIPQRTRRGGCRVEPIAPLGDDPVSQMYCSMVTKSPYAYRITILSPTGAPTNRWAEADSLRGNTWYECKCGYEELLKSWRAPGVLEKLDHQMLNHVDIARTCGFDYRYIVSSQNMADLLRQRWFGNVVIDVVPSELCGS